MTQLLPEQTAYAEFTLTETPDSLPTVAAYKVSAGGVFGTASGMSETIVNVSGLSYYASAIVPEDAAPGDRFSLLVTVTVGGTASVFWLALGQVAGNALTPEQAAWIEETHAKAMLIGSPGAFAYRKIPVITANAIEELVAGDDYAASMNRSLQWARPTSLFGDFTGATVTFTAVCIDGDSATIGPVAGTVKDEGTEAQSVEFELSKTDTAVHEGAYAWTVVVTKTDQTLTVARGNTRVVGGLT